MQEQDMLEMVIPWEERIVVFQQGSYTIERVRTQWDYELEGYFLGHCIGTKNAEKFGRHHQVFSVRDKEEGIPHATVLCVYRGRRSPYGASSDLGTKRCMTLDTKKLRVLQVRGRHDAYARPEYIDIVVKWFQAHGGKLRIPLADLMYYASKRGDDDEDYHFDLMLDNSENEFLWSYRALERARAARKAGTSR